MFFNVFFCVDRDTTLCAYRMISDYLAADNFLMFFNVFFCVDLCAYRMISDYLAAECVCVCVCVCVCD